MNIMKRVVGCAPPAIASPPPQARFTRLFTEHAAPTTPHGSCSQAPASRKRQFEGASANLRREDLPEIRAFIDRLPIPDLSNWHGSECWLRDASRGDPDSHHVLEARKDMVSRFDEVVSRPGGGACIGLRNPHGQLVGISFFICEDSKRGIWSSRGLVIDPRWQHMGAATALKAEGVRHVSGLGCAQLQVTLGAKDDPGVAIWKVQENAARVLGVELRREKVDDGWMISFLLGRP